jgi:hypothetical protein
MRGSGVRRGNAQKNIGKNRSLRSRTHAHAQAQTHRRPPPPSPFTVSRRARMPVGWDGAVGAMPSPHRASLSGCGRASMTLLPGIHSPVVLMGLWLVASTGNGYWDHGWVHSSLH